MKSITGASPATSLTTHRSPPRSPCAPVLRVTTRSPNSVSAFIFLSLISLSVPAAVPDFRLPTFQHFSLKKSHSAQPEHVERDALLILSGLLRRDLNALAIDRVARRCPHRAVARIHHLLPFPVQIHHER